MARKKPPKRVVSFMPWNRTPNDGPVIAQTVRLPYRINQRLHRAAKKEGKSFNFWALTVLNDAADAVLSKSKENDGDQAGITELSTAE